MIAWFVGIAGDRRLLWWDRFLRPGAQHALALGYDDRHRAWLLFDPRLGRWRLRVLVGAEVSAVIAAVWQAGGRWIEVPRPAPRPRRPLPVGCVGAVERVVRTGSGALRPEAYARWLMAHGGSTAFEDED